MMLIMDSKAQRKEITFEFDKYIPCSMYFKDKLMSDFYWRAGNGDTSLIEIGILNSGILNSITVVSISDGNFFKREDFYISEKMVEKGLPVFNTLEWMGKSDDYKNIFLDNFSSDFIFIVGLNYIEIVFGMEEVDYYLENYGLFLGFSENRFLVKILISDVDENIISMLKFFY